MAKCRRCEAELDCVPAGPDDRVNYFFECPYVCSQEEMDEQEIRGWATAMYFCKLHARFTAGKVSTDWIFQRVVGTADVLIPDADCDLIMKYYKKYFSRRSEVYKK